MARRFLLFVFMSALAISNHAQVAENSNDRFSVILEKARDQLKASEYDSCRATLNSLFAEALSESDLKWQGIANSQMGVLCIYEGNYPKALEYCHAAIPFLEAVSDTLGLAECHNTMGSIYFSQNDYVSARNSYRKSYALLNTGSDSWSMGNAMNNLGLAFSKLGYLDSALYYHTKSLELWEQTENASGQAITLEHIGNCLAEMGEDERALDMLLKSRSMMKAGRDAVVQEISIGTLLRKLGEFEESIQWCESALKTAQENNFRKDIQRSCECIYQGYLAIGDSAKALSYYQKFVDVRDKLFGQEKTKEITSLEMQYAFEKQQLADSLRFVAERELQEERIQRQRIGLVYIGGMLLLAAALALVIHQGKQKSEALLLNILPKQTAEELKLHGKAASKKFEEATVVFTDFKGFTSASEKLSPEELVAEINECFSAFDEICAKHRVEKIKTIGDAYMAVGGVPEEFADSVASTVRAALEMQEFMKSFSRKMEAEGKPVLQMRVGVHTGPVVAGIVGTRKFQYDIWGDTVNTASRLESSGDVERVNISESTYQRVKNDFAFEPRGMIEAKGKGKIAMYFVSEKSV